MDLLDQPPARSGQRPLVVEATAPNTLDVLWQSPWIRSPGPRYRASAGRSAARLPNGTCSIASPRPLPYIPAAAWTPSTKAIRNLAADTGDGSRTAKVARAKPSELVDACVTVGGERIVEPASYDRPGRCNQLYPAYSNPRLVAGAPLADDVLKCALKPIVATDYARPLTEDQLRRLRAAFPAGVCDYARPGVGQRITQATWLRF
jgi:hypothetical protein